MGGGLICTTQGVGDEKSKSERAQGKLSASTDAGGD